MGWFRRRSSGGQSRQMAAQGQGSPEEYARILGRVPLFVDLSRRDLLRLAATARQRDYAAGAVLVQQDQPGAGLYVIVSGRVHITQRAPDGSVRDLGTLGPGDVFGEMALFDDDLTYRTATVTALEPTRVLVVPVFDFRAALREDPDIGIRLLAVLSRRLRRAESRQV